MYGVAFCQKCNSNMVQQCQGYYYHNYTCISDLALLFSVIQKDVSIHGINVISRF